MLGVASPVENDGAFVSLACAWIICLKVIGLHFPNGGRNGKFGAILI